jgi:hypothetical protein
VEFLVNDFVYFITVGFDAVYLIADRLSNRKPVCIVKGCFFYPEQERWVNETGIIIPSCMVSDIDFGDFWWVYFA